MRTILAIGVIAVGADRVSDVPERVPGQHRVRIFPRPYHYDLEPIIQFPRALTRIEPWCIVESATVAADSIRVTGRVEGIEGISWMGVDGYVFDRDVPDIETQDLPNC